MRYLGATRRIAVAVPGGEIAAEVEAGISLPDTGAAVSLTWPAAALHPMDDD